MIINHTPDADPTCAPAARDALRRLKAAATVISESPDEESHQAIRAVLVSSG
ncbi:MAG: hypothetical protein WD249_06425 [Gaiellaceae bacterium]